MAEESRRPPAPVLTVPVTVRLSPSQYDAVYRRAQTERVSIPELIRRQLNQPEPDD